MQRTVTLVTAPTASVQNDRVAQANSAMTMADAICAAISSLITVCSCMSRRASPLRIESKDEMAGDSAMTPTSQGRRLSAYTVPGLDTPKWAAAANMNAATMQAVATNWPRTTCKVHAVFSIAASVRLVCTMLRAMPMSLNRPSAVISSDATDIRPNASGNSRRLRTTLDAKRTNWLASCPAMTQLPAFRMRPRNPGLGAMSMAALTGRSGRSGRANARGAAGRMRFEVRRAPATGQEWTPVPGEQGTTLKTRGEAWRDPRREGGRA